MKLIVERQGNNAPLIISPQTNVSLNDLACHLSENYEDFLSLLYENIGIIFRGFEKSSRESYQSILESLGQQKILNYVGGTGTGRSNITKDLVKVSPVPFYMKLPLHCEMSYSTHFPKQMVFVCEHPAIIGGHTLLADNRCVTRDLKKATIDKFIEKGLIYKRFYYNNQPFFKFGAKNSIENTFKTSDRQAVEAHLNDKGWDYEWVKRGLYSWNMTNGYVDHPVTKDRLLFNHINVFVPKNIIKRTLYNKFVFPRGMEICYGDHSKVPNEIIDDIYYAVKKNIVKFDWHKDDLLWIDNLLTLHGRSSFVGKRRTFVGMIS